MAKKSLFFLKTEKSKNTQGSFVCECAPGYKGNGKFCEGKLFNDYTPLVF